MGRPVTLRECERSESYQQTKNWQASLVSQKQLSARARMGLRLLVHTAAPTVKAAAEAVGLTPQALTLVKNSPAGQEYMETAHKILEDKTLEGSVLLDRLGRRGVEVIAHTMEEAGSEALRLKAAQDLADRSATYSKVQKHQVESFTLSGKDAKEIAAALVDASSVHTRFAHLANQDFVKVSTDRTDSLAALPPGSEVNAPDKPLEEAQNVGNSQQDQAHDS